ncbi:ABC transporter permease [Muricauda sp. SCSIO 64092]|uniref:ABC transporter permease n=1 Tax=Allomuricauda sp. SCSIO 64092 TaxID=2908842 RepID=UPI001FF344A7|nr:ABC transporter permease [Muricauda sp. SCSIO 64092]UOY09043.1 ABC transporter permease [Muricauda sp. SCSIO 64092]
MFKNYLKIAWRNLKKQPFFTFLNTFGLAIGIAGSLLICLYIHDELSFDRMFADAERIHRVNADIKFGGEARIFAVSPAPMAETMDADFSEVELVTRFRTRGSALIRKADTEINVKEPQSTYVDSTFFKMFGIKLLVGDPTTALKSPNTLVLTKTAAEKHFGIDNALGQNLLVNDTENYTVAGVIDDLPSNSFLRDYTVFMAMAGYEESRIVNWGSNNYQTFFKLIPTANVANLQEPLRAFLGKYVIPGVQQFMPGITEEQFKAAGNHLIYSTIPLVDIHLHSDRVAEMNANNDIQSIYILSFIAAFLIVLACVNFMNLSTAHSLKRAKEVGIRKTLGSKKRELIRQFLMESGLVSFGSLLIALVVATIALPFFNELADKSISIPFDSPGFWSILIVAGVVLGLLSGSYPAFFMSKFIPVKVLKGASSNSIGGGKIRNALVIFQFSISIFLIISTMVVYQQLNFIQNKDLGFSKDQVLIVNDVYMIGDQSTSFKEEVGKLGFVKNVTLSSYFPTPSSRSDNVFMPMDGVTDQENAVSMQTWGVDHDYISTLGLEVIAGRDFDRRFKNDSTSIIVNESAVAVIGVSPEEAVGMQYTPDVGQENPKFFKIIGVVKDFHFSPFRNEIESLSMHLGRFSNAMAVKLEQGSFSTAISSIERIWNDLAPGQPFDYYFMEDSFNNTYQSEQRLGRIFIIFTVLSIIIACLGLFGLATFNAEKRTKEIGVRKVMGAGVGQIVYRLTMDFLKLVGVAILVSIPLGWYVMGKWLEDFSYRIEIGWWVFILAALLALIISIVTVSYQSIKAAIVNPVKSLRTE